MQLAQAEKLKPLEVELRRLEDLSKSIVDDFAYMRAREEEMRDTNGKAQKSSLVSSFPTNPSNLLQLQVFIPPAKRSFRGVYSFQHVRYSVLLSTFKGFAL